MGNDFTLLELSHRVAAKSEMSRLFSFTVTQDILIPQTYVYGTKTFYFENHISVFM